MRFKTGYAGSALERFASRCSFDAGTGCVLWTGGQTSGRGHSVPYGAFWFEGRRWFAHRWAAKYIHKLPIEGMQVDHCCPNIPYPDTLCVQHLQAVTPHENRLLQTERQRYFVLVQKGYEQAGPRYEVEIGSAIPFYEEPGWLKDFRNAR